MIGNSLFLRSLIVVGGIFLTACTDDLNLKRAVALKQISAGETTTSASGSPFAMSCDGDIAYAPGEKLNLACSPIADGKVSKFKIESTTCPSDFLTIDSATGNFAAATVPSSFEGCKVTVVTGDGGKWCPADDSTCRTTVGLFHLSLLGDFDKSSRAGSNPLEFVSMNGKIYFFASYNRTMNIFTTDGTAAGTSIVARLPGENYLTLNSTLVIGSKLLFVYGTTDSGKELWVSDGTQAGTRLLKDIWEGSTHGNIAYFTALNGIAYFRARSATAGAELWRSDGTESGTYMVKDICPGTCNGMGVPYNINGVLYFLANDGVNGTELWRSDGTEDGTFLIKDINPGSANSGPANFTKINGKFFFSATDAVNGTELWKSDGTESSTVLVKDICPGTCSSAPQTFLNLNGTLILSANDGSSGLELYKSDGTGAGTLMVADIEIGSGASYPGNFVQLGAFAYFSATTAATGYELWRTDGSTAMLVVETDAGANSGNPTTFTVAGTRLFWRGSSTVSGAELWAYDPASAADDAACVSRLGTGALKSTTSNGCYVMPQDLTPGSSNGFDSIKPRVINSNTIIFRGTTPEAGGELWRSDGTVSGTQLVKDLNPTADSFGNSSLTKISQNIYLGLTDLNFGLEPRIFNEATGALSLLKDTAAGSASGGFNEVFDFDGRPVWSTTSGQIWIYDPTVQAADDAACVAAMGADFVKAAVGAGCLGPLVTTNCCGQPSFMKVGGLLYFRAQLAGNGYEFWTSDGTQAGTKMVSIDASQGSYSSTPDWFIEFKGAIYLNMNSYPGGVWNGQDLWKYDPTPAADTAACVATHGTGFHRPSSGVPGCMGPYFELPGNTSRSPSNVVSDGSYMYFTAYDSATGAELYMTDGSPDGSRLIVDLAPGVDSSSVMYIMPYKGKIIFRATGTLGAELYMYNPAPSADDAACAARDGAGFVRALTPGCVGLFKDIAPGVNSSGGQLSSSPYYFGKVGDKFLFMASTPELGHELWTSDGTPDGTKLLKDIRPGPTSLSVNTMNSVGNYTIFTAITTGYGRELWITDGTPSGTRMLKEIYPGEAGSEFGSFTRIGNSLYFSANTPGGVGIEPWKLIVP